MHPPADRKGNCIYVFRQEFDFLSLQQKNERRKERERQKKYRAIAIDYSLSPKISNLFFEDLPEPFFHLLKFLLLLVSDRTDSVRAAAVDVAGAKGETKVNQSWIDHESAIDSVQ